MTWGEAIRLTQVLRRDPASQVGAALQGWDFPIDRATAAVLDLFDLEHAKATKRPKPHPGRPYDVAGKTQIRKGNAAGRSREEIRRILNEHGHDLQPPTA